MSEQQPSYDPDEPVGLAEIGRRTGRSRQAATERAGRPEHPEPRWRQQMRGGRTKRLYRWGDVDQYYREFEPSGRGTPKPYAPEGAPEGEATRGT